jgi:hypothetical protein
MKIALCLVLFLMLNGVAPAQDLNPSFPDLTSYTKFSNYAKFSREPLSNDSPKAGGNQGFPVHREPTFTKEKLTRPSVLVGLGMIATGAVLAATSGESATVTTFNPVTQQSMTSTIDVTNNGRRWVGIGLLGSGGVLTFLGLSK